MSLPQLWSGFPTSFPHRVHSPLPLRPQDFHDRPTRTTRFPTRVSTAGVKSARSGGQVTGGREARQASRGASRADDRHCRDLGREGPNHHIGRVHRHPAGRQREQGVAVPGRVHRAGSCAARPSWAICATLVASALVRRTFVATTPRVVFSPFERLAGPSPAREERLHRPSQPPVRRASVRPPDPAAPPDRPRRPRRSPRRVRPRSPRSAAGARPCPGPPSWRAPTPNSFPTVAPAPAPTLPSATGPADAARAAA